MNVLDIDLDFFVHQRVTTPLPPGRPSAADYTPWTADDVEAFLTDRCGLDPKRPLLGSIVTEHHELFAIWRELIATNRLASPFELVHVDAHADMGISDGSPGYISARLLHKDVSQRTVPSQDKDYGLLPSNYVAFAMACEWIESFTYVHHPRLRQENMGDHDIPDRFFKDYDRNSDRLQFKVLPPESFSGIRRPQDYSPLRLEPEIPVEVIPGDDFVSDAKFSFMFVAHSPRYTPPTADKLLPVLKRYITPLS